MKKKKGGHRIGVLLVLCAGVFSLFLARLAYLQFWQADYYHQKAEEAASSSYRYSETAARGDITDRNGLVLAEDALCYDVYLRVPAPPGTTPTEVWREVQTKLNIQSGKDVETQLAAFCSSVGAGEFLALESITPVQAGQLRETAAYTAGGLRLAARGVRAWPNGTLVPHLLGITGPITAEQWQANDHALAASGYAMDAFIGQSGLEAAFETVLHGKDGIVQVTARLDGDRTKERETELQPPTPGSTLRLTLDAGLQTAVQTALQNQIQVLRTTKGEGKGREASAGAAVVVDTTTGGILAAVSWPGFDLSQYRTNYAVLSADPALPLYDRVLRGVYAPGSAFKPAVAAAALSAGTITTSDTVSCTGAYHFYSGYQPHCLQISHSGPVNLFTALKYSCNIYFYDVGRRVGVDAFSAMAARLGLASDTGAELPQAPGKLTWSTDANCQSGLVLQAAIGQGNTAVTPLQLASYACTLANSGVRYRLHFADALVNSATGAVETSFQPQVMEEIPGGDAVFGPIREGMKAMATTLLALREVPVPLACKTGSPQRADRDSGGNYYTNSVLIGYAPADAPQVAVAVVLEYGGGGANAAPVLRDIVEYLYGPK